MFAQIKAYLYGGAALVVIGLSAALWFQTAKVDRLQARIDQARADRDICLAANETSDNALKLLIADMARADKNCERRVKDKDKLIADLRRIDELGGANEPNSGGVVGPAGPGSDHGGDALLDALNGLLPGQGGSQDGVCPAAGAAGAPGAPLVSGAVLPPLPSGGEGRGEGWYCLNAVNAKNLLKDWALCRAWAADGVQVIEGLK